MIDVVHVEWKRGVVEPAPIRRLAAERRSGSATAAAIVGKRAKERIAAAIDVAAIVGVDGGADGSAEEAVPSSQGGGCAGLRDVGPARASVQRDDGVGHRSVGALEQEEAAAMKLGMVPGDGAVENGEMGILTRGNAAAVVGGGGVAVDGGVGERRRLAQGDVDAAAVLSGCIARGGR